MYSVISIEFNNENNFPKEKIIYNKGNILGRPKTAIKRTKEKSPENKKNDKRIQSSKLNKNKVLHKQFTLPSISYKTEEGEEEERHYIGNILKSSFSPKELLDARDIDPNPKVNRKVELKQKQKDKVNEEPTKPKPYIPPTFSFDDKNDLIPDNVGNNDKEQKKEIKEKDLRIATRQYKNNSLLEDKIKLVMKNSKFLKNMQPLKNEECKINPIPVEITDIEKDKKYQQAKEDAKKFRERCNNVNELTIEINQTLMKNKANPLDVNNKLSELQINEVNSKAQKMIDSIKDTVDPDNFDINQLKEKDRKLLTSRLQYKPPKRPNPNIKTKKNLENDKILVKSKESIGVLQNKKKVINKEISKQMNLDFKEEIIQENWKIDDLCSTYYCKNLKKGKLVEYDKVKNILQKEVSSKEDIFDYMYFTQHKDNESTSTKSSLSHPFLIYD